LNKREKEVIQSQLDKEKAVLKKLELQYQRALSDIINKTKILQADIDMLQEAGEADDKTLSMVRSKVYQKQYQQALQRQIIGILDKLHSDEYTTIQAFLNGCYEDGFIGTMYALQGQGIPIIAPIDTSAAVKAVQLDSKVVEGYYKHLGVDFDNLKKVIPQEVSRGIASSLPYTDIARNLNNASQSGLFNAKRIARTEGHRIQQQSADDARNVAKKKGADVVKQWDASLDSRTRDSHRRVDGEIRENDEKFSNGLRYAGDPNGSAAEVINCRCVTLTRAKWALDEEELETLKDRAAYFGLDKTENFEDYKKKYLKAAKETVENSEKSSTMGIGLQFFANRSIPKQKDGQLVKSINSWQSNIEQHKNKLANPARFDANWDSKTDAQKAGLIKHWQKEIRNFEANVKEAEDELKKRGHSDD
jgi:hypothetical protein